MSEMISIPFVIEGTVAVEADSVQEAYDFLRERLMRDDVQIGDKGCVFDATISRVGLVR